jgi:hypothetical protein
MDAGKPPGQVKNLEERTLAGAPLPHLEHILGVGKAPLVRNSARLPVHSPMSLFNRLFYQ